VVTTVHRGSLSGLYSAPGDIVLAEHDDGRIEVVNADPTIWISAQLVELAHDDGLHPAVTVRCEPATCPTGDVWTIDAVNRRVVYRVGEYLEEPHCYRAEWPD
jgi:hypothetical protein